MITSIVILTWNKLDYTKACIESIRQYTTPGTYELIIVDNASTDDTVAWLKQQPDLKLVLNADNKGFPAGCNQGIEIATGDNILLLNNDVVVTDRWLDNLVHALYADPSIGAVGPATNSAAYLQTLPVSYKTIDEMHRFASTHNRLDPAQWEERLKLIGFCMLIRRDIVDQIGLLDERFTPGNFEDDDYSVRIRHAGYRLLYCKDTFIHHFGSTSWKEDANRFHKLLSTNEAKFEEKWGYNATTAMNFYPDVVAILEPPNTPFRVLEVMCGAGATLLRIKNFHPQAELYGVERNEHAAREARSFADIRTAGLDVSAWGFEAGFFDVIVLPFVLEEASDPQAFLQQVVRLLSPRGKIIAKVMNASHFTVVYDLLRGKRLAQEAGIRPFAAEEMNALFTDAGLGDVHLIGQKSTLSEDERRLCDHLNVVLGQAAPSHLYDVKQWLVRAQFGSGRIEQLLEDLREARDVEQALQELNEFPPEQIIAAIERVGAGDVALFNRVASLNYQSGRMQGVLPYLMKAHEIDADNADTLYNLGYVLQALGQHELALPYLQRITPVDEEIESLIRTSQDHIQEQQRQEQERKHLLHRIEFEVEQERSLTHLLARLSSEQDTLENVLAAIRQHSVDKPKVLNALGATAFGRNLQSMALPFLQAALQYAPQHTDSLYNLGVICAQTGNTAQAVELLSRIVNPDEEVRELIANLSY